MDDATARIQASARQWIAGRLDDAAFYEILRKQVLIDRSEHERSLQARYEMAVKRIAELEKALHQIAGSNPHPVHEWMDAHPDKTPWEFARDLARSVLASQPTNPTQEDE